MYKEYSRLSDVIGKYRSNNFASESISIGTNQRVASPPSAAVPKHFTTVCKETAQVSILHNVPCCADKLVLAR